MSGFTLTEEQQKVLETCPSPPARDAAPQQQPRETGMVRRRPQFRRGRGQLVRVTAAAGAGKTTTLLALAKRAAELGHRNICYVTYTKAAANDGKVRLQKAFSDAGITNVNLDAATLHSFAKRLLDQHLESSGEPGRKPATQPWTVQQIKSWISTECEDQIWDYMEPCRQKIRQQTLGQPQRLKEKLRRAQEKVEFFIYKSLAHFCHSSWSLEEFTSSDTKGRNYYPAVLFHRTTGKGEEHGFDPKHYNRDRISFYADQACRLWNILVQENIRSFDFEMKQTQLLDLKVPCTLLLVDESQDMDGCQVNWIGSQLKHGTHVYTVGDPAQAIYGFRGAKSQHLMDLPNDKDCSLTESWRFGKLISNVANLVLFAKENSWQTGEVYDDKRNEFKPKNWIPYRTSPGFREKKSVVTTESLLPQWRTMKITLIAFANATLFMEILGLIGFVFADDDSTDSDDEHKEEASDPDEEPSHNVVSLSPTDFPKVHINGRGADSGLNKWKNTLKMIRSVYELFSASERDPSALMTLDESMFPDFVERRVNWNEFVDDCIELELSKYQNAIAIVSKLRHQTMEAMDKFRENVMEKEVPVEQADIIFTTCHLAKGLEWENVQVCDDFFNLSRLDVDVECPKTRRPAVAKNESPWTFGDKDYGDHFNLPYVACTRAKSVLSIPASVSDVLDVFDGIHTWKKSKDAVDRAKSSGNDSLRDMMHPTADHEELSEDALAIYKQLVLPLRKECGLVDGDQLLAESFLEVLPAPIDVSSGERVSISSAGTARLVTPEAKRTETTPTWWSVILEARKRACRRREAKEPPQEQDHHTSERHCIAQWLKTELEEPRVHQKQRRQKRKRVNFDAERGFIVRYLNLPETVAAGGGSGEQPQRRTRSRGKAKEEPDLSGEQGSMKRWLRKANGDGTTG